MITDGTTHIRTPVSGVGEAEAVSGELLDVTIAIETLDERVPGHIVGTDPHNEGRVELSLQVEPLDHHLGDTAAGVLAGKGADGPRAGAASRRWRDHRGGGGGAVLRIRGEVRGPDIVELVIDDQVEALHIEPEAIR